MRRSERVGLVLTPQEKAAVKQLAETRGGFSVAAFIRSLIRREAKASGIWLTSRDKEGRHEED